MEDKEKKERSGVKAIIRHLTPYKKEVFFLVVLGVATALANGSIPYITGKFFDTLIDISQGIQSSSEVKPWIIFLGLWAIVQIIDINSGYIIGKLRRGIHTKVHLSIQADGFIHLLKLPMSFHKNERINEVIQRFSNAGWRVSSIVTTIVNVAPQLLSILIGLILMASINLSLTAILAVGVTIYLLILIKILKPTAAITKEAHKIWNESWGDAASVVHQIESVKQSAAELYEEERTKKSFFGGAFIKWMEIEKVWNNINVYQHVIVFITQLLIFVLSVKLISEGLITVGELVAFNGYALMFFGPFASLGHNWQTIQNGVSSAAEAEEIFKRKIEEYKPKDLIPLGNISGEIEFKDVNFRYNEGEANVLSGVSFKTNPGEIIALVGKSGVGKSTLISLISGYYFPQEGSVLIDGKDTRKMDLAELRKQIAVVPQEVALFNDTIEKNIKYGSFRATKEEMEKAAKEAHMKEFVENLPNKYRTVVGERGIKLSVGQKQRVSIARAILRNPNILILDEPTSALDSETEKYITEALEKLMKGRTTFIIAHRLSTVRKANRIFFIEDGKIAEEGSHDELMKIEGGKYRGMYELHIGLY